MKTRFGIDAAVMQRLEREAARQGRTMSELVEAVLRASLCSSPARLELPPLPVMNSGGALVDIADRAELYGAIEG